MAGTGCIAAASSPTLLLHTPFAISRCSSAALPFSRSLCTATVNVNLKGIHLVKNTDRIGKLAWGSLGALLGRLRAAFEENGGKPESNPFGARALRMYLREVRENQAKAWGIAYEKKKRKRPLPVGGAVANDQPQQQQPHPQDHSQTNPLTGHGYAQHRQHSQQHTQQSQQHSQPSLEESQHSQHGQHNHSPVSHPLNSYAPNSNPLSPFSQQLHTSNLIHGYAPNSSSPLNPYSQPSNVTAYQDLQLHNHTAGPMLS